LEAERIDRLGARLRERRPFSMNLLARLKLQLPRS